MASINRFSPIQLGTGDPSPENVRPIFPAISIAGGKNLLDISQDKKVAHITSGMGTFSEINGGIQTSSEYNNLGGYLIQVKPNTTYTYSANFSISNSDVAMRIWEYETKISVITNGRQGLTVDIFNPGSSKSAAFTTSSVTNYIVVGFYTGASRARGLTITNMMVEEGSIATEYEPYQSLDVYGGYLDIANSRIIEEWDYKEYDGSELWTKGTDGSAKDFMMKIALPTSASFSVTNLLSNYLQTIANNARWGNYDDWISWTISYTINTGIQSITTVEDWKSYLALHLLQVVYKLATPVTHYLSPTQLAQAMDQLGIKLSSTLIDARRKILLNSPHLETTSGSIASFKTDMKAPLKECKIHFLPVQSGSGDPSPDNVRPITGWTGVTAEHSGKNVAHIVGYSAITPSSPTSTRSKTNNYGTTISTTNSERSVTITQTKYSASVINDYNNGYFLIIDDNLKFGERYNVAFTVDIIENPRDAVLSNMTLYSPSGSGFYGRISVNGNRVVFKNFIYNANKNRLSIHGIDVRICGMSMTVSDICITPASETDYSYEPYQSTQIPVSFGDNGTIYGGYVDLVSGELMQEWKEVDLGSLNWSKLSNYNVYSANITDMVSAMRTQTVIAENYKFYSATESVINMPDKSIKNHDSNNSVYVMDTDYTTSSDVSAFKTAMAGMKMVYKLAIPITYQLTPQQLKSLKGVNNIWSDANDITEVKYWTH